MKIAITLNENSFKSDVSSEFEKSQYLLISNFPEMTALVYEKTDNMTAEELAQKVIDCDCECVITGEITTRTAFDLLADAGITRYNGSDYSGAKSVELMNQKKLPLTKTFSGETGCSGNH